ncbi:uncharacterized protein SCHCODRAFT_02628021 [Schizophyllum commune H4-8]|uniref:uncharacterized protein n=1 Tax=Schizophyllum commune (strain H4-8 / FGSC 9210) TaxID=578458 RepID=UPI00215F24D9|nr:uncharacterized protein SCHCODRAFT_02628021 [Schizophyllum commune H4-8]KAI5891061.1 hypothetical protein SCHCODRAFT_02628021 [Schizophyllum commune H4-8]
METPRQRTSPRGSSKELPMEEDARSTPSTPSRKSSKFRTSIRNVYSRTADMLNASPKKLTRKRSSNEPQGQREDTSVLQPTTPVRRPATSVQRPTTPVQRSNTDRPELFPGLGSSYWSAARERAPAPSVETMQTQIPNDSLYDDDEYEYSADAVAESYQSLAQALTSDEVLQALNMVAGAQASASEQGRPLPEVPDSLYTAVAQVANVCSPWLSVYRTLGAQTQVINNGFETVIRLARETKQEAHAQARKNEARLERLERALDDIKNKPLPPTPSQPTANASTSPSTQSKAHKAAAAPKAPSNNTMEANHPSRLALEIRPGGLPKEKRMDELTLRDSINGILRDVVDPEKVQVAGTKWNPQGNCIVVTRQDQRASDLIQHVPKFAALVGQGMEVIPRLTAKWLRLMIHDVRTGLFDANPSLHTSGELKAELEFSNPIFKTLGSLAEDPRWLRRQQDIGTLRSTIVFAVTSKEEYETLLEMKALWVYGRACRVERFADKPPVVQCTNCWGFGHTTRTCKTSTKCRLCSADHPTTSHAAACPTCQGDEMAGECTHNVKCRACGQDHPSDDRRCPKRLELYGNARAHERERRAPHKAATRSDGFTEVTKRKKGKAKKAANDQTSGKGEGASSAGNTTKDPPPHRNRFDALQAETTTPNNDATPIPGRAL